MNAVIITSVINPVEKELMYTNSRSIFTQTDRYNQTLLSINSVRQYINNSYIIFIECSNLKKEYEEELKTLVDKYINLYFDENLRSIVESPYKGWGESIQILKGIEEIENISVQNLYKLSGRYYINEKYNKKIEEINKVVCKKIDKEKHHIWEIPNNIVTVFFKIPKSMITDYYTFLISNQYMYSKGIAAEKAIKVFLNSITNKEYIIELGISGFVSVDGSYYEA